MVYNIDEFRAFLRKIELPEDGVNAFCCAFQKVIDLGLCPLTENFALRIRDNLLENDEGDKILGIFADITGLDPRQACSVLFIRAFMLLKEKFLAAGYSEELYNEQIIDLRCKIMECYLTYGVWGDVVRWWFSDFLRLQRFALGRFQYQKTRLFCRSITFTTDEGENITLPCGTRVLNFHIPSSGISLTDDVRLDSYKKAYSFYKKDFEGKYIPFVCSSWLLYPKHPEFLPKNCNILKFFNDFYIIDSHEHDGFGETPRIFYMDYDTPLDKLPTDTSLQRAYIDWLKKTNKSGSGYGIFLFDGERVINNVTEFIKE